MMAFKTTGMSLILATLISVLANSANAQNKPTREFLPYYGKILNAMIKTQINSNVAARARSVQKVNQEVLLNELYRVLSLNHIEKADQGFDAIVNECNTSSTDKCYKHGKNDYTTSRGIIYNELDKQHATQIMGSDFVVDVYCQQVYMFPGNGNSRIASPNTNASGFQNSRANTTIQISSSVPQSLITGIQPIGDVNIEHTWPQSRFNPAFSKELQKGDLHHLYPSNAKINGIRGHHVFGEVEREDNGVPNCPSVLGFDKEGDLVFEPVDSHKGNVARALFYFSIRYQIAISPSEEAALKAWHLLDPVDDAERERNNKIFAIQKNRNPFVDFPEIVAVITDF